jgi:hypothetical protein
MKGIKIIAISLIATGYFACERANNNNTLLAGGEILEESQWKLYAIVDNTTHINRIYPKDSNPYIIYFKKDGIVEFPYHCNISNGKYEIRNDGTISFDGFYPATEMYCEGLYDWEWSVVDNLLKSKNYFMTNAYLTINCEENLLYFEPLKSEK